MAAMAAAKAATGKGLKPSDLLDDTKGRGARIGGGGDRPTTDQMTGPGAQRLGRG